MSGWLAHIRRCFPVCVVAACYLVAAGAVLLREIRPTGGAQGEDVVTIRIAHYQLETGVRHAIEALAEEYRERHPDVRVVQEAIPDMIYGQWLTTQLIGGNPPDICQTDQAGPAALGLSFNVWLNYLQRYFVHITPHVMRPNPHNAGTPMEGVPYRETFKDNLRSGYSGHFMEFFGVPMSRFSYRVFCNMDLLASVTGSDETPADWHAFEQACRAAHGRPGPDGTPVVAIANSRIHLGLWETVADFLTHDALERCDFNRDGGIDQLEVWSAVNTGRMDFQLPSLRARLELLRTVAEHSQPGFVGLVRDDAIFQFVQSRALFLMVGSNEARSVIEMVGDQFEVGVMDKPYPEKDDPAYGTFVLGKPIEETLANIPSAFMLSVTKDSRHQEIARDFLQFMTSREGNARFNQIVGWLPIIRDAETDDLLEKFEPRVEGISGSLATSALFLGGETQIKLDQMYKLYLIGQIGLDDFLNEYQAFYLGQGKYDFHQLLQGFKDSRYTSELSLVQMRSRALWPPPGQEDIPQWGRYHQMMWQSQFLVEFVMSLVKEMLEKGPDLDAEGPYTHTDRALANLRAKAREEILAGRGEGERHAP
jgi:ABC-type glycerol-3-phosphate transport system substrate-binding protein